MSGQDRLSIDRGTRNMGGPKPTSGQYNKAMDLRLLGSVALESALAHEISQAMEDASVQ
jgi:hypothetical protein